MLEINILWPGCPDDALMRNKASGWSLLRKANSRHPERSEGSPFRKVLRCDQNDWYATGLSATDAHYPSTRRLVGDKTNFNCRLKAHEGMPAFQADSRSGEILQGARGCGNSGLLLFAAELDPAASARWHDAYEKKFWKDTGWMAGFTELPAAAHSEFMDVDSGPVLFGFGSVASAFGIGAARSVGRFDHAAPLTVEIVACSWPTPFGLLVPGLMGRAMAESWCLGEVALLFSMTRPACVSERVPFEGPMPSIVWVLVAVYTGVGLLFIWFEIRSCRRLMREYKSRVTQPELRRG